jgi:hypothetical protein
MGASALLTGLVIYVWIVADNRGLSSSLAPPTRVKDLPRRW